MKKKSILGLTLVLTLSGALAACGNAKQDAGAQKANATAKPAASAAATAAASNGDTDAYYLGVVAQLSGPAAAYGMPTVEGMEYEVERLNAMKFTKKPIKLEIVNDESKESQTVSLTNRLTADKKFLALGGFTSSSLALAAKPVANREGITQLVWSTSDKISNPLEKWTFQIIPTAITQAETAMKFLQNKGVKKVAIIHEQGDFGDSWEKGVVSDAKKYNLDLISNEKAVVGEKDFSVIVSKVKSSGAEGLFVAGSTPMSASVAKALKQLKLDIPVVNGSGGTTAEFARLAGPDGVGLYGISTGLASMEDKLPDGPAKDKLLKMRDEYTKKTGKSIEMMQSGGITLIDLFATAVNAAEKKDGKVTRENLRDAVENIKDETLWVGNYTYSPTDHLGVTNATPLMINKGEKWEFYLSPDQVKKGEK